MTNKELLELAAKAAGIPTVTWNDGTEPYSSGEGFIQINNHIWNPITNDGDALRLAVKLRLGFKDFAPEDFDGLGTPGMVEVWRDGDSDPVCAEWYKPSADRYAATRRAIVRAAAEIGKEVLHG